MPDPLQSDEERQRFHHEDLLELAPAELDLEWMQVVLRLTFDTAPHPWLVERLDLIDARLADVS